MYFLRTELNKEKELWQIIVTGSLLRRFYLTLKAPITTAADDIHKYFFIVFQRR